MIASIDEYVRALPEPLREIAARAREVIDAGLPDAEGRIWHGHPVWMIGTTPVALLKAYLSYVTFGLFQGQSLTDPSGLLVAGGRQMASLKLREPADVDDAPFADWLRQVQERMATPVV